MRNGLAGTDIRAEGKYIAACRGYEGCSIRGYPRRPVLDHLMVLEGARTDVDQVRAALLAIVRSADVLVGHSAENDLRCLRIAHAAVVDMAALFANDRRKKSLNI